VIADDDRRIPAGEDAIVFRIDVGHSEFLQLSTELLHFPFGNGRILARGLGFLHSQLALTVSQTLPLLEQLLLPLALDSSAILGDQLLALLRARVSQAENVFVQPSRDIELLPLCSLGQHALKSSPINSRLKAAREREQTLLNLGAVTHVSSLNFNPALYK